MLLPLTMLRPLTRCYGATRTSPATPCYTPLTTLRLLTRRALRRLSSSTSPDGLAARIPGWISRARSGSEWQRSSSTRGTTLPPMKVRRTLTLTLAPAPAPNPNPNPDPNPDPNSDAHPNQATLHSCASTSPRSRASTQVRDPTLTPTHIPTLIRPQTQTQTQPRTLKPDPNPCPNPRPRRPRGPLTAPRDRRPAGLVALHQPHRGRGGVGCCRGASRLPATGAPPGGAGAGSEQ